MGERRTASPPAARSWSSGPTSTVSKLPNPNTIAQSITTRLADHHHGVRHGHARPALGRARHARARRRRPSAPSSCARRCGSKTPRATSSPSGTSTTARATPSQPSPEFQALRDNSSSNDVSVCLRRNLYSDILGKLQRQRRRHERPAYGLGLHHGEQAEHDERHDLDARPGARRGRQRRAAYTITQVTDNPNPYIRRRIVGNMTVPLYMTTPPSCTTGGKPEPGCPGSSINRDASGKPTQNGTTDYPVPRPDPQLGREPRHHGAHPAERARPLRRPDRGTGRRTWPRSATGCTTSRSPWTSSA